MFRFIIAYPPSVSQHPACVNGVRALISVSGEFLNLSLFTFLVVVSLVHGALCDNHNNVILMVLKKKVFNK